MHLLKKKIQNQAGQNLGGEEMRVREWSSHQRQENRHEAIYGEPGEDAKSVWRLT